MPASSCPKLILATNNVPQIIVFCQVLSIFVQSAPSFKDLLQIRFCFTFGFCLRSIKYNFHTPSTRTMLAWISIYIENHALCVYSKTIWIWMFINVLETLIVHHSLSFLVVSAHMRSSFIQISEYNLFY